METDFQDRLKTWREKRGFNPAEAAAYINSLKTGDHISEYRLLKLESGFIPTPTERMLLEFFMKIKIPSGVVSRLSSPDLTPGL